MLFAVLMVLGTIASYAWSFVGCIPMSIKALAKPTYYRVSTHVRRHLKTALSLLLVAVLTMESVSSISGLIRKDDVSDDPATQVVDTDQLAEGLLASSDDEGDPLPAVDLTAEQIAAFLDGYSRRFSNASLASRATERKAAADALGEYFEGHVNFPWQKLYDRMADIQNGTLAGSELESFYKEIRHDFYQEVVSNPVMGHMLLQVFAQIPAITENNSWILDELAEFDSLLATERGISDLLFDTYSETGSKIRLVTDEYAELAAKLCVALDFFTFSGITTRKSAHNWYMPVIMTDNQSHTTESDTQEGKAALLLLFRNKDGSEGIALGVNVYDKRMEIFGRNTPDTTPPVTTTPSVPDTTPTTPSTPPSTPSTPSQPKTTSANVYISYKLKDSGEKFDSATITGVKEGASWSKVSPTKSGYTCLTPTATGTMSVPAKDQYIDVWYTKNAEQYEPTYANVTINYWLKDSGEKFDSATITGVKEGASWSKNSPTKSGYTCLTPVATGTMSVPARDQVVDVWYTPEVTTANVYISYKLRDTGATFDTATLTGIAAGAGWSKESPVKEGYTCETPVASGTMPNPAVDQTVVVWYSKNVEEPEETYADVIIDYKLSDTGEKFDSKTLSHIKEGASWSQPSPEKAGYICQTPTASGTMPIPAVEQHVTVWYTPEVVKLDDVTITVRYWQERVNGTKAATDAIRTLAHGSTYSIESPDLTASGWELKNSSDKVISGTATENKTIDVIYTKINCTVTVRYVISDGKVTAPSPVTKTVKWGESYSITSPNVSNYKPDREVVSGTAKQKSIEEVVTYSPITNTVTIYYRYADRPSVNIADPYVKSGCTYGQTVEKSSPTIDGYKADRTIVKVTVYGKDIVEYVYYTKIQTVTPPPTDGNGTKDPGADPPNKGNADWGGGQNSPTEHPTGEWQPSDPDSGKDYPTNTTPSGGNNSTGGGNNNTTTTPPLTPDDPKDSSGTGGTDHTIVDSEGGNTENGTPPATNPLPSGNNETWHDPGNGGAVVDPGSETIDDGGEWHL